MLRAMYEYARHPDLPEDIIWLPRWQYDPGATALSLNGEHLVTLHDRVDGGWFAVLHPDDSVIAPYRSKPCESFDTGKRGAEIWVLRHETQLRAKVAKKRQWIHENVSMDTPRRIDMSIIDRRIEAKLRQAQRAR